MSTALEVTAGLPMALARRAVQVATSPFGPRNMPLSWLDRLMDLAVAGLPSAAGVDVTPRTSLQSTAVHACVRLTAETVAALPIHVYRTTETGKQRTPKHPLQACLHDLANPEMTALEFRECSVGHLLLWGNGYAEIERNDAGVKALWPLRPDMMTIVRMDTGQLGYLYRLPSGQDVLFRFEQIYHLRGWSLDGIYGLSPIDLAKEAIGADIAVADFGARFFSADARPGGILNVPGQLSKEAKERLRDAWDARFSGLTNRHRTAVLEAGVTWQSAGIPPENAQFLETRRFNKVDIAAIFRTPPALLGWADSDDAAAEERRWVKLGLTPLCTRIEQAMYRDLVRISDGRRDHYVKHNLAAMERGDLQGRYDAYAKGRQNGWLSADDIRELEDMNPLPDGQGKVYLVPANMVPASMMTEEAIAKAEADKAKAAAETPNAPTPTAGAGGSQPGADGMMNGERP